LTPGQTATDTFTYTVADPQGATSNPATVQVTIQGVNEPPVLTITNLTSPVPFSATVGSVAIAETVVIDDPDSPSMTGIWVEFTGTNPRPDGQAEYLQITFQGSTITGTNNFIFIWTDPQPTQAYVDALQTIQYVNNRATPTAGCRQISFQVTDDRDRTSNVERVYVQVNGGTCPTAGVPSIQSMAGLPDHHRSIQ
jgi:hypothetical protein